MESKNTVEYFRIMKDLIISLLILTSLNGIASPSNNSRLSNAFKDAYQRYSEIPEGLLESISYNRTRIRHLDGSEAESCIGIPRSFGSFGLIADGKGYFSNTLTTVSELSNISTNNLVVDESAHILGYARAIASVSNGDWSTEDIVYRLHRLSELPRETEAQRFALTVQTYEVLSSLNNTDFMSSLGYEALDLDLRKVFDSNLDVLQSDKIVVSKTGIIAENGSIFKSGGNEIAPCYNYAADNFVQTPTCNFSSRAGTAISAITIHTIQGTYAGAISWAQNCNANVSYHYVVSNTGQITQMLCESDKGWHVGSENPYTIGIEHDGIVSNPDNYTNAMYLATAALCKDITESGYGIEPLRTAYFPWAATTHYNVSSTPGSCIHTKGHQHFPNQTHTDPGQYWDWDYFYKLMNPTTPITTLTDPTGEFFDSGGEIGVYYSDDRTLTLIQPTDAESVSVTFQSFDLEENWDYLYVYNGTDVFSPLIGMYTGLDNPGTVTSNEGHLLFEFRSDCAIAEPGWSATYEGTYTTVNIDEPNLEDWNVYPNPTTGIVNLPQIDNLNWELFDAAGRLLANGSNDLRIDFKSIVAKKGVYSVRLSIDDNQISKSILFH